MKKLQTQSSHLSEMHGKFTETNECYLLMSQNKTISAVNEARNLLLSLTNPDQPLQHKYKLTKLRLEHQYQTIEQ